MMAPIPNKKNTIVKLNLLWLLALILKLLEVWPESLEQDVFRPHLIPSQMNGIDRLEQRVTSGMVPNQIFLWTEKKKSGHMEGKVITSKITSKINQISTWAWFLLQKLLSGLNECWKRISDYFRMHFLDSVWLNYGFSKCWKLGVLENQP